MDEEGAKTVYSTKLRQRRDPNESDDMGVVIVSAMEEATKHHLERIGAQVFLAMTSNGFEHTYQTTAFTVQDFKAGSPN